MTPELLALPIALQTGIGAGYLGYRVAYSGLDRDHRTSDAVMISFAFGLAALAVYQAVQPGNPIGAVPAAVIGAVLSAAVWRAYGRALFHMMLRKGRIHGDDGLGSAWDALVQRRGLSTMQVSVHTADGRTLYQNDGRDFVGQPFDGLYLGSDGSILLAVQEEELADGTEETRSGIIDPDFGLRLTYIPATEVRRVNIRVAR